MKVMSEAPPLRYRRLVVTEYEIPYQVRASGDGVTVVVAGVTTCHEDWESQS